MPAADRNKSIPSEHLAAAMICLSLRSSADVVVPAVQFIAEMIRGVAAEKEIRWIQLGLQEAVRNAFEHGSLEIGSVKKRKLNRKDGALEKNVALRRSAARNRGKIIEINAAYSAGVFFCTIEDSGPGFGWRAALKQAKRPPAAAESEGRGLFLLKKIFDQIKYNRSGNKITLIKKFSAKKSNNVRRR